MKYARSDVSHVAISVDAGGCGASHSRPVTNGKPEELWKLECPQCEHFLQGDPLWSATEAEIPETYDEKNTREDNEKRGERALKKSQEELNVNQHALTERIVQLMEQNNANSAAPDPDLIAKLVQEQVAKALAQMNTLQPVPVEDTVAPEEPEPPVALDLDKLHWKTLQKMCKQKGLPETGSREDLVKRLKSA